MMFSLIACNKVSQPPALSRQFTDQQLTADFPSDLGPERIDVAAYPPEQQSGYDLFVQKCGQCHTLARPINAALSTEEEWTRYIERMHGKAESRFKEKTMTADEAKRIVEFLVFDSRERKLNHPQEFQRQQEQLREMFKAVQEERTRVQNQEGREKARESAPYMGDKPS